MSSMHNEIRISCVAWMTDPAIAFAIAHASPDSTPPAAGRRGADCTRRQLLKAHGGPPHHALLLGENQGPLSTQVPESMRSSLPE